jgi:diguanylate cyclase (GGDEF)-like protein/PAS domain S-box-containing protein
MTKTTGCEIVPSIHVCASVKLRCFRRGTYNEQQVLPLHMAINDKMALFNLSLDKLISCYLFEDYQQAFAHTLLAKQYLDSVQDKLIIAIFYLYDSLTRIALYSQTLKSEQKSILSKVDLNQKKLEKLSHHTSEQYLHKFYLVSAERCRLFGKTDAAMEYYDHAIALAKEHEYFSEEALANELTAKFYLSKGIKKIATIYMQDARCCYLSWGATDKVKDLDARYPYLLDGHPLNVNIENVNSKKFNFIETSQKNKLNEIIYVENSENTDALKNYGLNVLNFLSFSTESTIKDGETYSELSETQNRLNQFLEAMPIGVAVFNSSGQPYYLNRAGEELCGKKIIALASSEEISEVYQIYIAGTNQKYPSSQLPLYKALKGETTRVDDLEIHKHNKIIPLEVCGTPIFDENGKIIYAVVTFQDISERKRAAADRSKFIQEKVALKKTNYTLQRLANIDGLTQVANRRRFDEWLRQVWRQLTREQVPLSLIFCDVDHFKLYNDTYGHQAGDNCLQQVAQAISRQVKRPADLVARYGGEEFAVILPNTPGEGALAVAQTIRQEIHSLKIPHAQSRVSEYVTLSLGVVSMVPTQGLSPEDLISNADKALYKAKEQGRDRIIFKAFDTTANEH